MSALSTALVVPFLIALRTGFLRLFGSVSCVEKSPSHGWVVIGQVLKRLSALSRVSFVGVSITMFGASGRLGTEC